MTRVHGACPIRALPCRTAWNRSDLPGVRQTPSPVSAPTTREATPYTEYFPRNRPHGYCCNNHVRATVCAESHCLPTPFCPERTTAIFMAAPASEEGTTDDSVFAMPGYCPIHTEASVIIPPSDDTGIPETVAREHCPGPRLCVALTRTSPAPPAGSPVQMSAGGR